MSGLMRDRGPPNPSRETKLSVHFPFQLNTSRIGNQSPGSMPSRLQAMINNNSPRHFTVDPNELLSTVLTLCYYHRREPD